MLSKSEFIFRVMSLINSINIRGELGSPCFRPMLDVIKSEYEERYLMQDLTTEYMEEIAFASLLLIFSETTFCQRRALSTLSNAFS